MIGGACLLSFVDPPLDNLNSTTLEYMLMIERGREREIEKERKGERGKEREERGREGGREREIRRDKCTI